jgi:hypothetical protein
MLRRVVPWCALASLACGEPSSARPQPAPSDKRALYGDPVLVPTREGERRRREVALAGEIERALRLFPELEEIRVHVEADSKMRVAVIGRARTEVDAELRARLEEVVTAIAGPDAARTTTITAHAPEQPTREPRVGVLLVLALLGLGASCGITADRLARRRRGR